MGEIKTCGWGEVDKAGSEVKKCCASEYGGDVLGCNHGVGQ